MLWRGLLAVVVLAAAVLVAAPVGAQAPETSYSDVPEDAWYREPVAALEAMGVFEGTDCDEGFCPGEPLKRWQMAVWVVRILDGGDPAAIEESRFTDLAGYERWGRFIERLAELEVTGGCRTDPPGFCPQRDVSRSQMAAFLQRALDLPDAGAAGFTDVSEDSWAYGNINALAASGITSGCRAEPYEYCPMRAVTKAQMATFLFRALQWQEEQSTQQPEEPEEPEEPQQPEPTASIEGNPNNIPNYNPDVFYTEENELSRFVKNEIVDVYGAEYPWLVQVWDYTNRPGFEYRYDERLPLSGGAVDLRTHDAEAVGDSFDKQEGYSLYVDPVVIRVGYDIDGVVIHELAHVYTLSHGIVDNPVPLAAAYLYFGHISARQCGDYELYAEAAEFLEPEWAPASGYAHYWRNCPVLPDNPTAEAVEVVRQAFAGQTPDWFEETYRVGGEWD